MRTLAIIVILAAGVLHAADVWLWVDVTRTNGVPVRSVSIRDRDDLRDMERTGVPIPSQLPALVHVPSGAVAIRPASIAAGQTACLAGARVSMGATNAAASWAAAVSTVTAITKGKRRLAGLRNAGKNIPTSKEREYYMAVVDALVARVEVLETSMRRANLTAPADILEDEP